MAGRTGVAALALALVLHGSTKRPAVRHSAASAPVAARTLTDEDFARGFVMRRVGMGERFDFSSPSNSTAVADWRAFGAAEDWVYLLFTNRAFRVGTNDVGRIRLFSSGRVATLAGDWVAPLATSLGIVPEANWGQLGDSAAPSEVWYAATPQDSLVVTWRNALLGRRVDAPVSFQTEFFPDGRIACRYDLSRMSADAVSTVLAGAFLGGGMWTTNALAANVTSLEFHPLTAADAHDSDADGDGLPTADELFVYGTCPHRADTDCDGLSDSEELLVRGTDPLDPNSLRPDLCDGYAVLAGGLDPLAPAIGSTNAVLEHVFYAGSPSGAFELPRPTESCAILRVRAAGTGTGDLVVDGHPVPLVAARDGLPSPELIVSVERGRTVSVFLRGGDGLRVEMDADEFLIGVLPSDRSRRGWIRFPDVVPPAPCIHDLATRRICVARSAAGEDADLGCEWMAEGPGVSVSNIPPRAAVVTGGFPADGEGHVRYRLSHPLRLAGGGWRDQPVRLCPRPSGDGDEASSPSVWRGEDERPPAPAPEAVRDDIVERCAEHDALRATCEPLHQAAYTNALAALPRDMGILPIRARPVYRTLKVDAPPRGADAACCPCPDHATNLVTAAFVSRRLRVEYPDGRPFAGSATSCAVCVCAVLPSAEHGDSALAFATTGRVSAAHAWTTLGAWIAGGRGTPLDSYDRLSSSFGVPVVAGANVAEAPELLLETHVGLPSGWVRVALDGAEGGGFRVWWRDAVLGVWRVLLDAAERPAAEFAVEEWRSLLARAGRPSGSGLPVRVTASASSRAHLALRYWTETGGEVLEDGESRILTAVDPPLRFDADLDGAIGLRDLGPSSVGGAFVFWTRGDTGGGRAVGGPAGLIDLFPAALDLGPLLSAWGESVSCRLDANGLPWDDMFEWTLVDVPRSRSGSIWTEDVRTSGGGILRDAALRGMPAGGTDIPRSELSALPEESRLLVLRARDEGASLRIRVLDADGTVLLSYAPPMVVLRARRLYDWTNVRRLLGGRESYPSSLGNLLPEPGEPMLVFLHGFSVSEEDARAWGDALFKRLRLAGSRARFHCVAWRGDQGGSANYQENVANAFASAGHLAAELKRIPGRIVLMAHSLGNVVASSMVQDHGLGVGAYLMLDAAVPAEAYDTSAALRVPQLVHPDWDGYPTNSWTASWHRLFMGIPGDGRSLLGWPGRFAAVAPLAVNFYSTGDEVLELSDDNDINILTGIWSGLSQYAWHKQEMFKGRGIFDGMGATTWSGWNIDENFLGINRISAKETQRMSDADFRTNTVFVCTPKSILDPKIDRAGCDEHLAMGIPALTPAAGTVPMSNMLEKGQNIDLNLVEDSEKGIPRPNGWPERGTYSGRWLHSDVKDVPYFYTYKLFEKIIEKGNLR